MADAIPLPRPKWALAPSAPQGVVDALRLPRLWAQILYNRGIESRETAWELLHASEDALHDPFLFAEMDVAVDRVLKAIEEGETIAVFGDFDTDGVTASALLYEALLALGGDAFVHLPHRVRDGHGLNAEAVEGNCRERRIGHHHRRLRHHLRRRGSPGETARHRRDPD